MPRKSAARWKCSRCKRTFAKKNQWHSCQARTVNQHFQDKPANVRKTYDRLIARLRRIGPLRIDAVKTSINLAGEFHFGGVRIRKEYLRVGFLSDRMIEDSRIVHTERLGPAKFGHSVILRDPADVDGQLIAWLKRAYDQQSR